MMSPSIFEAWDVFSPRCLRASPSFPERIVRRAAKALFHASESFVNLDVNQFSIITELLGTPPDDVIETICSENVRHANFRSHFGVC